MSADPDEIKRGILAKSGSRIANIPIAVALDPAANASSQKQKSDPGDEDPSREILSAEIGMTFDGNSNGGSADLAPFIKRRLQEIVNRMGRSKASTPREPEQK